MRWFYMGIAQIALDPRPSVKQANVEKKCPKPSWHALTPPGKRGKKVPQTILLSPYTPGQTWEKKCPKPSWEAFTPL